MAYAKIIDIDDPGYFRLKSIDQSQLKQFLKNPADWAYHRLNDDHKPTDAMKFGTAFHAYLLGTSDVVSLPEGESFRSKDNQKWRDEQLEAGNIIVSYNDMQLLKRMKEGIEQTSLMPEYPDYMEIIEQGTKEQCIEWKDRQTGLMLKAKPDLIPVGTDYLVDLKTAQKADAESFAKEVINYGYHIQTVFYRAAVAACKPDAFDRRSKAPSTMQFWVFEKSDACDWQPFSISDDNPITNLAATSIRQALLGIALMVKKAKEEGYAENTPDPVDAAAKYALRHGFNKKVKEVSFQNWQLLTAENMLCDLAS
ncbi:PD-(D/E)XK nuclease-like domain-containing protein [Bifidobacterium longum]|uniref:PD-(D/E)XK nuclease-like domain-containing protein n=1 Tax=Bifidobacterium longum TaxID=216816 RepID=UPI0018AAE6B6|nr:PD-(D/E)XK nuclease-like domain-containing protein [Bifidobacterium longum]MDB6542544.1 PD-(D/E)XK nuclease-like domain-containing protein [Bifidobacterium longum]MDB6546458.1 PD-(D/E)XK nuclease-like domain-containing protein [Bifidobacterium longum]MDB6548605.1 PD-(D/E)XK nuclease-like domain-containing protein [Bifidobacterium longum]MDB6550763.1 PD-(D/E)XK nuclease-like domain-containing protein [Bifidobacterium longum]MDB6552938.1 PD-(D/E)XK nuclease-like domain-containing protein [Bif